MRRLLPLVIEIVGLQTPRGRIMFFILVSLAVYIAPYKLLSGLSLWQHFGIDAPSIGLTRAYWHVLHLDFYVAWLRNPLIYLVLSIGVPLLLADAYKIFRRKQADAPISGGASR